jgi:hypothetical protein
MHGEVEAQTPQSSGPRVQIGFAAATNDASIENFLADRQVKITAIFSWTAGLTGTYRLYAPGGVKDALSEARERMATTFEDGLKANTRRLSTFLEMNARERVAADESLETQARSLLNIRQQLEDALESARRGDPIVFAIEVEGPAEQLESLRSSQIVRAFQRVDGSHDAERRSIKPDAYRAEFRDPSIQALSPEGVYRSLQDIASSQGGR